MSVHFIPFEELYVTHYLRIYRHVYRLVKQHEQAEDLTQMAFLKAWRAWPPASHANLPGWLSTIATRVALDALAHARLLSFQSLDTQVEWMEETASPVREDEVCLERLVLSEALRQLPTSACTLLLLWAQGYSATEAMASWPDVSSLPGLLLKEASPWPVNAVYPPASLRMRTS